MTKVTVLGAGAWGTALALQARAAGNDVILWAYLEEEKEEIQQTRENKQRLPGIHIPEDIQVTCDLKEASQTDVLLVVTPAQAIRGFLEKLKPHLKDSHYLVFCSKGIDLTTGALLSEISEATIPGIPIAILSGPNFAQEIAQGKPGAATLATHEMTQSRWLASALSSSTFRIYPSDDIMGAQIGGALKNVIAIASGMVTGAKLGENARAALIARGLQEIARYGEFKGAKRETFMGLSGVGDLVLCCVSPTSRNMKFGFQLGEGKKVEDLLEGNVLTEGAHTVKAVMKLIKKHNLDMPICTAVYRILYEGKTIVEEMERLLTRPQKSEIGSEACIS